MYPPFLTNCDRMKHCCIQNEAKLKAYSPYPSTIKGRQWQLVDYLKGDSPGFNDSYINGCIS